MTGCVVDASVNLAWFFEDEKSSFSESALDRLATDQVWVPALWLLECANVLVSAQRRGRINAAQHRTLVERATALPLLVDREPVALSRISEMAEQSALTAYDAAYLELAQRRSLTLLTLDARLVAAARVAGQSVETA